MQENHKKSKGKGKVVQSGGGLPAGSIQSKSFSQHGNLFALVNDQGVLRIWDTETNELKQEYTPNLHLSGPCNVVLWVNFVSKKKSDSQSNEGLYLALGGNSGEVQLYSYSSGSVEGSLKGEKHSGKINGLAFDGKKHLYSCGDDFQVIVWDLKKGARVKSWNVGNEKPQALAYLPESESLAVAGRGISVYSIESQKPLKKFTGHTSEVTVLETFTYDDDEYLLSASKMERVISLWKVQSQGNNAIATFLMEDVAAMITLKIDESSEALIVSACTRSGVVHIHKQSFAELKSSKPVKPLTTIQVAFDSEAAIEPITVVAASLRFSENGKEVLFAYGDKYFLMFEKKAVDYSQKIDMLLRAHPKDALNAKKKKKGAQDKATKTLIPTINPSDVSYKSATAVPPQKASKPVDTPMDQRLQNLHLSNGEIPQSQSKVNLLVQALHSKDSSLLSTVLSTDDEEVIKLTIQKLPVQYVSPLVSELTSRMQRKSSHVQSSMKWMKALTQIHASQLMAQGHDDLLEKFGPCIAVIEQRISCMSELSKLNGRLQLLVNQISRTNNEDNLVNENVLVFEDNDSDEETKLDRSLSDDEWDEDDEESEEGSEMEVDA